MPISSYLAWPVHGGKGDLSGELNRLSHCEATPSSNKDVVILVTDTKNEKEEERLKEQLLGIKSLGNLTLVYAHGD